VIADTTKRRQRPPEDRFLHSDQARARDGVARVRVGSYEFKKKGVSRFDLRDPYISQMP
jgi:hypothetical protein